MGEFGPERNRTEEKVFVNINKLVKLRAGRRRFDSISGLEQNKITKLICMQTSLLQKQSQCFLFFRSFRVSHHHHQAFLFLFLRVSRGKPVQPFCRDSQEKKRPSEVPVQKTERLDSSDNIRTRSVQSCRTTSCFTVSRVQSCRRPLGWNRHSDQTNKPTNVGENRFTLKDLIRINTGQGHRHGIRSRSHKSRPLVLVGQTVTQSSS